MYKQIEDAWQAGLDALKPSPAELERGLELHRDALVVESYGFAPAAGIDSYELERQALEEGASADEFRERVEDITDGRLFVLHSVTTGTGGRPSSRVALPVQADGGPTILLYAFVRTARGPNPP